MYVLQKRQQQVDCRRNSRGKSKGVVYASVFNSIWNL